MDEIQTIQIIYMRLAGTAGPKDYDQWATRALVQGYESEELIELASCPDMHWERLDKIIPIIYAQIGLPKDIESNPAQLVSLLNNLSKKVSLSGQGAGEFLKLAERISKVAPWHEGLAQWLWLDDAIDQIQCGYYEPPNGYTMQSSREDLAHALLRQYGQQNS